MPKREPQPASSRGMTVLPTLAWLPLLLQLVACTPASGRRDERCSAATCSGCCAGGACHTGLKEAACGADGELCVTCEPGEVCLAGACAIAAGNPQPCDRESCPDGCCAEGVCLSGTSIEACGGDGRRCTACASDETCTRAACAPREGGLSPRFGQDLGRVPPEEDGGANDASRPDAGA